MEQDTQDTQDTRTQAEIGADALDAVVRMLQRFLWFHRIEAYWLVALWIAHTWVFQAFEYTPRLDFTSRTPGCGKSMALKITGLMCADTYRASGITGPAVRIKVHNERPTMALDQANDIFGATGRRREDVKNILVSGYCRDEASYETAVGNGTSTKRWETFCPAMFAGIGALPPELQDRAFAIVMRKPPRPVERYRRQWHQHDIEDTGTTLGEWARSVVQQMADIVPDTLDGVDNRSEDIAEPLLVIGEMAGEVWRERARDAVTAAVLDAGTAEAHGLPLDLQLLADIREVLARPRMRTSELTIALMGLEDSRWAELWTPETAAARMAELLKPFGIMPKVMRIGKDKTYRGYERRQFEPVWAEKLPAEEAVPVPA